MKTKSNTSLEKDEAYTIRTMQLTLKYATATMNLRRMDRSLPTVVEAKFK